MKCRICSSEFTPAKSTSRYCSRACSDKREHPVNAVCRAGLHKMTPENRKYKSTRNGVAYYTCRACAIRRDRAYRTGVDKLAYLDQLEWSGPKKAKQRATGRGHVASGPSADKIRTLQMLADGLSTHAVAAEFGMDWKSLANRLWRTERQLGVSTSHGAVLRGLVRGWIVPDRSYSARRRAACRTYVVRRFAKELRLILAEDRPARLRVEYRAPLAALGAESLAHAVSLLYAHGLVTRYDAPPDGWKRQPQTHQRKKAA